MKKVFACMLFAAMLLVCAGCHQKETGKQPDPTKPAHTIPALEGTELEQMMITCGSFSYEELLEYCPEGTQGVQYSDFLTTGEVVMETREDLLGRAREECGQKKFDSHIIRYDSEADLWCVSFWNDESLDNTDGLDVFLDGKGVVKATMTMVAEKEN